LTLTNLAVCVCLWIVLWLDFEPLDKDMVAVTERECVDWILSSFRAE
jgi:hypothetical protein